MGAGARVRVLQTGTRANVCTRFPSCGRGTALGLITVRSCLQLARDAELRHFSGAVFPGGGSHFKSETDACEGTNLVVGKCSYYRARGLLNTARTRQSSAARPRHC